MLIENPSDTRVTVMTVAETIQIVVEDLLTGGMIIEGVTAHLIDAATMIDVIKSEEREVILGSVSDHHLGIEEVGVVVVALSKGDTTTKRRTMAVTNGENVTSKKIQKTFRLIKKSPTLDCLES